MDKFLIWSNEHKAWWRAGGWGYTTALRMAGHFTQQQAIEICRNALPTATNIGRMSEIPVRLEDIEMVLTNQIVPKAVWEGEEL